MGYSRFDFINENGQPLINEVEMVNPSMYTEYLPLKEKFFSSLESFLLEGSKK